MIDHNNIDIFMGCLYGQYNSGRTVYEVSLTQKVFMAKYSGEKSQVDAYQIKAIGGKLSTGMKLQLENDTEVVASSLLTRRFAPSPGDYWVIQEDGTISLISKQDFEERFKLYLHEL